MTSAAVRARSWLGELGVSALPTQRELYEEAGSGPFSTNLLAAVMNEIWASRDATKWQDHCLSTRTIDRSPSENPLGALSPYWIAHVRTAKKLGHLVVVSNIMPNRIEILDPEPPGDGYWMTSYEFKQIWTGSAVYLVEEDS